MKAITIKAPWAQLIFTGGKDIENRDWWTAIRGSVAIHVSKKIDLEEINAAADLIRERGMRIEIPTMEELKRQAGCVLGVAEIVDCVRGSSSPWFVGYYGFVLTNPRLLAEPVHCRGMLGFWDVPPLSLRLIEKQLEVK